MIFELYIKREVWMEKKEKVGTGNYHVLVLSNSELEASTGLKAVQIIAWMSSVLVIACDHPASSLPTTSQLQEVTVQEVQLLPPLPRVDDFPDCC